MSVSAKYKFIFIHIPKTAGSSVLLALQDIDPTIRYWYNHNPIVIYKKALNDFSFNSAFKFCFVRNPWERMVSFHRFLISDKFYNQNQEECDHVRSLTFNQFIKYKTASQKNMISVDNKVLVDYIGQVETFDKSLKYISKKIGVSLKSYHDNTTKHDHYSCYYDQESKQHVEKVCAWEIEKFNYKFESKPQTTLL